MKKKNKFDEVVNDVKLITKGDAHKAQTLVKRLVEKGKSLDEIQETVRAGVFELLEEIMETAE